MTEERLQKTLARAGVASRRAAEELIREGRITVNGKVAHLGQKVHPDRDAIKVNGKRVASAPSTNSYLLLNKPQGYLTTRSDPEGRKTVYDLLPPVLRKQVFPVGRLDSDTEGLLLLTNDGEFAERVSHPRFGCTKTYVVKVRGEPSPKSIARLERGIRLDGKKTLPARIVPKQDIHGKRDLKKNSWWTVELREGRTRQIRQMFDKIGHPVSRLRRVGIGSLSDTKLPKGALRELSDREVARLKNVERTATR